MSREFLAVRSSSSLVLLITGAASLRTYFFVAHPALNTMAAPATITSSERLVGKFIDLWLLNPPQPRKFQAWGILGMPASRLANFLVLTNSNAAANRIP